MSRPFFNKDRIADFDKFERHAVSTISLIKARLGKGFRSISRLFCQVMKFHQSLTISSSQDVVARFTFDSATEFLFGKDVESIAAGLPYPGRIPFG